MARASVKFLMLIERAQFRMHPIRYFNRLVHITLKLYWEGIQLPQAVGFHEHSLGPIPRWRFFKMGATLPAFMRSALYRLNTKKLGLNSMAQNVFGGRTTTELETLNGYMLDLARRVGLPTPINETIYEVAKEQFGPDFQPISEQELWKRVRTILDR